jgi:hypothetical protein
MSITENNLNGTIPSDTPPPPRSGAGSLRGTAPPGDEGGDDSETDNDSAAARIASRTKSDMKQRKTERKYITLDGEQMKSLDVRSEGIDLETKK